jgi:hypothetical protein
MPGRRGPPSRRPGWTARRPQDRAGHGSRSGNYLVQPDTPAGASQQANWKWCSKCQGLTYAMPTRPSDGSYPVNGERLIHEFTHAWQIQHNSFVPGFVSSGIVNQGASIMGDDVYEHGLPGAPWASFNLKQQAQMVNQWYGGDNRQQHWGPMIQIILTTST